MFIKLSVTDNKLLVNVFLSTSFRCIWSSKVHMTYMATLRRVPATVVAMAKQLILHILSVYF